MRSRARRAGDRSVSRPTRASTGGCWPIRRSEAGDDRHPVPRPAARPGSAPAPTRGRGGRAWPSPPRWRRTRREARAVRSLGGDDGASAAWTAARPTRGTSVTAVRILRLAAGGDGVGRLEDGRTVFVPRTRAGRSGRARRPPLPQAFRPRSARPRARAVDPTGSSRAVPTTCDDECGGCQLQHLDVRARSARRVAASWAMRSAGWLGGTCPTRRSSPAEQRVRVPHQDHPRRERRRPPDRAASRTIAPTRSSSWSGATSPCPS